MPRIRAETQLCLETCLLLYMAWPGGLDKTQAPRGKKVAANTQSPLALGDNDLSVSLKDVREEVSVPKRPREEAGPAAQPKYKAR